MSAAGRTLARAGLIVSAAFLVSRVLGWVRLVVIANVFGATAELDAFIAAFRIPDLIFQLVAAGALSSALIPVVTDVLANDGEARAWRIVATVANLMLIALVAMAAIVFVFADVLVPVFTGGFDGPTMARTVELTRIMALGPIFLAMGSVATSVLNARGRFAAAAIAPITYNLAIIAAALLLGPSMGALGLAIGVVVGSVLHLVVQIPPLRAIGMRYRPVIDLADAAARRALVLMGPRAIGLSASQITFVVVTALATNLGVGAVTAFAFAFTLLQIPIGVIGVPLGVVLFPSLSRQAATGGTDEFLRLLIVAMLPVAVLAAILRTETVAVLFSGFSVSAIELTAATFLAFLPGLPAHALIAVLARAFYAHQDTITPVVVAIAAVVVNTTLATMLVGPLGLPGVALAIAIAAWLEAAALVVLLRRRLGSLGLRGVANVAIRTGVATAIAGLVGVGAHAVISGALGSAAPGPYPGGLGGVLAAAVTMLAVGVAYSVTFALAALALRIEDLRSIVELMVHALRRPSATQEPRAS